MGHIVLNKRDRLVDTVIAQLESDIGNGDPEAVMGFLYDIIDKCEADMIEYLSELRLEEWENPENGKVK